MEDDEGIRTFLEHNKAEKGQARGDVKMFNPLGEECKRFDYVPLKIDNTASIYFCRKVKACGHQCCGAKGETTCMPCIEPECIP